MIRADHTGMGTAYPAVEERQRSRRRPRVAAGPPCPFEDCGAPLGRSHTAGRDSRGRPIRARRCNVCGNTTATIEMVIPAKFSEVDDYHFRNSARAKRERHGWNERGARKRPVLVTGTLYVKRRTRLPEWGQEDTDDE